MIIGDSSALVAMATMDRLDLLEKIFGKVYVPQAVYNEVTTSHKAQSLKLKNFLDDKIVSIELDISKIGLGQGELEAIALYKKMDADFLLIDDRRAKRFAKLNGVNVIGALGVMILAKDGGFVKSIREDLEKLLESSLFISQSLVDRVLREVGEI
jgi:predicted nucleic acid-binding protein